MKTRIAVFASGKGSNFEAIIKNLKNDQKNSISLLIYDRKKAFAAEIAKNNEIKSEYINFKALGNNNAEELITEKLAEYKIDLIVLAGFMRIVSSGFINSINIPIINIHPSLLPKYKGINSIERAFNNKDKYAGISIHYVVPEVDSGELIFQKKIKVDKKWDLNKLTEEIHKIEHKYYSKIIKKVSKKL